MTSMPPRPPSPLTRTGNSCHISPSNQCSGTGNPSENPGTPAGTTSFASFLPPRTPDLSTTTSTTSLGDLISLETSSLNSELQQPPFLLSPDFAGSFGDHFSQSRTAIEKPDPLEAMDAMETALEEVQSVLDIGNTTKDLTPANRVDEYYHDTQQDQEQPQPQTQTLELERSRLLANRSNTTDTTESSWCQSGLSRESSSVCSPISLNSHDLPGRPKQSRFSKQSSQSFSSSKSDIPPIELTVESLIKPAWKPKKSSKPPTRPAFELPGEAFSRRKKALFEERLRREEEEMQRKRAFKASGVRYKNSPAMPVKENVSSKTRASIGKELEKEPPLSEQRWPFVKTRPSNVPAQPVSSHANGSPVATNHSLRRAETVRTRTPGAANRPALGKTASMSDAASPFSATLRGPRSVDRLTRRSSSFGSTAFSRHSIETADDASFNGVQSPRVRQTIKFPSTTSTGSRASLASAGLSPSPSKSTLGPTISTGLGSRVLSPTEKVSVRTPPLRSKGKEIFEREKHEAEERERQKRELREKMERARHEAAEQSRMAVQQKRNRTLSRKSIIRPTLAEAASQKK